MNSLFLIPARGGSKGLPGKNIRVLNYKPLIYYSIDFARKFTSDDNICVSTDSQEIIEFVNNIDLEVPFIRPQHLAEDTSNSHDVIMHAIDYYESKGKEYDVIILLQPTTPFRKIEDLKYMIDHWSSELDLYVSVKEPHDSPYFNMFEENEDQYLIKSKECKATRRQDIPKVYAYNGSLYIYNIKSLKERSINKVKKYIMEDPRYSIDIDSEFDWKVAETFLNSAKIK